MVNTMDNFSRRQLVLMTVTAGLPSLTLNGSIGSDHNSKLEQDPSLVAFASRWKSILTGGTYVSSKMDNSMRAAVLDLDKQVESYVAKFKLTQSTSSPFIDLDGSIDTRMVIVYKRLETMAKAWGTSGSKYYSNTNLLHIILVGLKEAFDKYYSKNSKQKTNWYYLQIALPQAILNSLTILASHVDEDILNAYLIRVDYYLPEPEMMINGGGNKILSDGANRVDICLSTILCGILGNSSSKVARAIDALEEVCSFVTEGTGFYADGSFKQHINIAYTGTYGLVALNGLAKISQLFYGSAFQVRSRISNFMVWAAMNAVMPVVYDGQMMDLVRGRAISRPYERSFDDGALAIETLLRIAISVNSSSARRLRQLCLGWITRSRYRNFMVEGSVAQLVLVADLVSAKIKPAKEVLGGHYFAGMDRLVYRGRGWCLGLSQSSRRTAHYETNGKENLKGFNTGSGMVYVYGKDQGAFDDDFWPTSDPTGLPGTTAVTSGPGNRSETSNGAEIFRSGWTGGLADSHFAMAAMHLFGPRRSDLQALKSIYCTPEYYVALGTAVIDSSGLAVRTTVDHRNLGPSGGNKIVVNGSVHKYSSGDRIDLPKVRWVHIENVAGYVFFEETSISILAGKRTGSWSELSVGADTVSISRNFVSLSIDHGINPRNGRYSYVALPYASEARTEEFAAGNQARIVRNDGGAQGVIIGNTLLANFWSPGSVDRVSSSAAACISYVDNGASGSLTISEPTQSDSVILIEITNTTFTKVLANTYVRSQLYFDGVLSVVFDSRDLGGMSVSLTLS